MDTVLVLDQSFLPVSQTSWKRALRLVLLEKAEIVAGVADRLIRSAGQVLQRPAVIRLFQSVKRKHGVRFTPDSIYLRDKGKCAYCRVELTLKQSTQDHVQPKSRGGKTVWENIVLCCFPCNQKKGDRTPAEAGFTLHVKPTKPHSLPPRIRVSGPMPDAWAHFMPWATS